MSPYANDPFSEDEKRPRALALIGDRVHDPAQIEESLTRAFSEAGVAVRFAFDVAPFPRRTCTRSRSSASFVTASTGRKGATRTMSG